MWIVWHHKAWENYVDWQEVNPKNAGRVERMVDELLRTNPAQKTVGKAERLKGSKYGLCSVRIDKANRLVYKRADDTLYIVSCKGHYKEGDRKLGLDDKL